MKQPSTLFLKTIVVSLGFLVLAFCFFISPQGIKDDTIGIYRPLLIGMMMSAIPFFIGLFYIFKLLNYIDDNKAFSQATIKSLGYVKYCALMIGVLYAIGLPYIFFIADHYDVPGVALLGLIFTFVPIAIFVFAGVFQELLQNAISTKSENDLMV